MQSAVRKARRKAPPQSVELGARLRSARRSSDTTLAALATKLKVTKGYLSRVESGKAVPSQRMLDRIARALRTDPAPLHILAGRLPNDLKSILYQQPISAPEMLRESFAEYVVNRRAERARRAAGSPSIALYANGMAPYETILGDCFDWMAQRALSTVHAIVTDPPYGLREYTTAEKTKLRNGRGGVWRIPPSFDGCKRIPVPRFTVLTQEDKAELGEFFTEWARRALRILVPGGHVFIATNPLLSHIVYLALEQAGFEKRGEIIRLVQTLRGGDRPKNAHEEFDEVTVMPRSCWEPWGLFRKPCEDRVQDNLRKWKTGGLRRVSDEHPFGDVIKSSPTRGVEREIAPHPSLKPQAFMREVVRAALPLGEGIILDPFMGAGSTIAAACAVGYSSIGIESDPQFYEMAVKAIPELVALPVNGNGTAPSDVESPPEEKAPEHHEDKGQRSLFGN